MTLLARSCSTCGKELTGRQRRFCSRPCKNRDTNHRLQNYRAQQQRGQARKLGLMRELGSRCATCGYAKNFAALVFHHREPREKSFDLDMRAFSNRSPAELQREAAKCELLCANCHMEVHNPGCALPHPEGETLLPG